MWGWFIANVFSVPQPGVVACIGLSLLVSMVKSGQHIDGDIDIKKAFAGLLETVFRITFILIIGFILHFWC
jgi:hypothetical protein